MKTIDYNGRTINVPTEWNEVLLKDYETWHRLETGNTKELYQCISNLCKVNIEVLHKVPKEAIDEIEGILSFLSHSDLEPSQSVQIDSDIYTLANVDKLTLGEWIDVDEIINNSEANNIFSDSLAVVCRPIGEEYSHEICKERSELFQNQSCDKTLPLISFFLRKEKQSKEISNQYSQIVEVATQYLQDIKSFAENGDGIKRLPIWQRTRFSYLIKLLEKQLLKCSDSYSIK